MGIISVEKANNLLWLGRYSERVYTTIRMFYVQFDKMIDSENDEYSEFCHKLNIPVIYSSNEEFISSYIFDKENPDSVIANLMRAYDNAIVLRDEIGTETMSYLQLCVSAMESSKNATAPLMALQNVLDMMLAFWACADDYIIDPEPRNLIKTGRSIERIDLYLRLGTDERTLFSEYQKLTGRIARSGIEYHEIALVRFSYLIQCEREDHPETDEDELHKKLIAVLETLTDY